jgi:cysteinyl-tRNA synthetase
MFRFFNSITNTNFELNDEKKINWYCCGPTIYNDSHLGHARTYIIFDSIKKYLKYQNCDINYGMNITDIDDKIVNKVYEKYNKMENKESTNIKNVYNEFIKVQEKSFWDDMQSLNVEKPDNIIRVSDVIPDIIKFIKKLIDDKYAYVSNGSVYFSMDDYLVKFNTIMSNLSENDLSLKNNFNIEKKNTRDFALWKSEKETDISWNSPWGFGRPGWHIECSVMMDKMFGKQIDIHSGGIDLKFPHHHNEYIQTTAYNNEENLIKCFLHSGHLHVDNQKMSQSLGNFITIKQFLKNYDSNTLRILFLMTNWTEPFDLTEESIITAKSYFGNLNTFINNLKYYEQVLSNTYDEKYNDTKYQEFKRRIYANLDNNFKSFEVFKIIYELINQVNKDFNEKKLILNQILEINNIIKLISYVFGLTFENKNNNNEDTYKYIESIISIRNEIRDIAKLEKDKQTKLKLFNISDKIRDKILPNLGIKLEDTNGIDKWTYI